MHKHFYASGFLYNSATEKILLQQTSLDGTTSFSFFSKKCLPNEDPILAFQQIITQTLFITIPTASIIPVYEYISTITNENYSIMYADIVTIVNNKNNFDINNEEWFTFKQITKLPLPKQISHDIMIGQRVIRANTPLV